MLRPIRESAVCGVERQQPFPALPVSDEVILTRSRPAKLGLAYTVPVDDNDVAVDSCCTSPRFRHLCIRRHRCPTKGVSMPFADSFSPPSPAVQVPNDQGLTIPTPHDAGLAVIEASGPRPSQVGRCPYGSRKASERVLCVGRSWTDGHPSQGSTGNSQERRCGRSHRSQGCLAARSTGTNAPQARIVLLQAFLNEGRPGNASFSIAPGGLIAGRLPEGWHGELG